MSWGGDLNVVEDMYKRALKRDANHIDTLNNYGLLLHKNRRDIDGAEAMYRLRTLRFSEDLKRDWVHLRPFIALSFGAFAPIFCAHTTDPEALQAGPCNRSAPSRHAVQVRSLLPPSIVGDPSQALGVPLRFV